jgi:hypothetical protein
MGGLLHCTTPAFVNRQPSWRGESVIAKPLVAKEVSTQGFLSVSVYMQQ